MIAASATVGVVSTSINRNGDRSGRAEASRLPGPPGSRAVPRTDFRVELLALPLSVDPESGRLARTDAVSALLSVIRAMAGTSGSGEGPTAWFGLQEMFAEPALQRGDHRDEQQDRLVAAQDRELSVPVGRRRHGNPRRLEYDFVVAPGTGQDAYADTSPALARWPTTATRPSRPGSPEAPDHYM